MRVTDWHKLDGLPGRVTREEFERACLERSGGTIEEFRAFHEVTSCDCGEDECPGWKAVYLFENRRRRRG